MWPAPFFGQTRPQSAPLRSFGQSHVPNWPTQVPTPVQLFGQSLQGPPMQLQLGHGKPQSDPEKYLSQTQTPVSPWQVPWPLHGFSGLGWHELQLGP